MKKLMNRFLFNLNLLMPVFVIVVLLLLWLLTTLQDDIATMMLFPAYAVMIVGAAAIIKYRFRDFQTVPTHYLWMEIAFEMLLSLLFLGLFIGLKLHHFLAFGFAMIFYTGLAVVGVDVLVKVQMIYINKQKSQLNKG